ncbi:hypothetical protein E4U58_000787 [Claviceps cyperi]|nr:hypothetical protein E4U58_000787 [Claviceps cyperi]
MVLLQDLFESKGFQVKLWVTDNDGAFINDLNAVFPEPRVLMCLWHMKKDVESYLRTQLSSTFGRHREGTRDVDNQSTVEFMKLFQSLHQFTRS